LHAESLEINSKNLKNKRLNLVQTHQYPLNIGGQAALVRKLLHECDVHTFIYFGLKDESLEDLGDLPTFEILA